MGGDAETCETCGNKDEETADGKRQDDDTFHCGHMEQHKKRHCIVEISFLTIITHSTMWLVFNRNKKQKMNLIQFSNSA